MLVLSRRVNESIRIGDEIAIVVTRVSGSTVSIAVDAPREISIVRSELLQDSGPGPVRELEICRRQTLPAR